MSVPPQLATRRAARRAQLRRRRLGVLAALLAAVLVVAIVVATGSGGSHPRVSARADAGTATPAARSGGSHRPANGTVSSSNAAVLRLARLGYPLYCAGGRGHELAFTFDDGPGPYTHYALKKLRQAHERATFFAVGRSIDNFPGWLARETKLAAIADHTLTHPLLTAFGSAVVEQQIAGTRTKIEAAIGQPVALFRPPYGARNATVDGVVHRLGMLDVLWSVDSADSLGANYLGIIHNVEAGMRPGAIILMHENRGQTIRALTTILPELRRRGLRTVTLPELLASDPPTLAQLKAGPAGCGGALLHGNGG